MKNKKVLIGLIVLCFFLCITLFIVIFLGYMGFFSKLVVIEKKSGPFTYAYEEFIGDYAKTGQVFIRVYKALEKEGIKTTRGIGVYFDDPRIVAKDKLRSNCGTIIEENYFNKLPELQKKFKIGNIKENDSIVVEFPVKNVLSYMIGPIKAYPLLEKYAKKNNIKYGNLTYEVYDESAKKVFYVLEIVK